MSLANRVARYGGHAFLLALALLVLGAADEARAVFACLPARNCQNVEQCCKKPRIEFWIQVIRAELRRDYYRSRKNRDEVWHASHDKFNAANEFEAAFIQYFTTHQDVAAKKRLGVKSGRQFNDVPNLTTGPDCKSFIDEGHRPVSIMDIPKIFDDKSNPLTRANVCKEAVVAAIMHEDEHRDRCEAVKANLIHEKSWAQDQFELSADKEGDAYAREAETLRRLYRQARKRCTTAKHLADGDFENAKQKVDALKLMRHPRSW